MRYIHTASGLLVDLVCEDITADATTDGVPQQEVVVGKRLHTTTGQHAYHKIPGDDMVVIVVNVFGSGVEVTKYE